MSETSTRQHLYEELVRRLAAAMRGTQLYAPGHPLSTKTSEAVLETLRQIHSNQSSIAVGVVGKDIVVGDIPLQKARENLADLITRLRTRGIERITLDRGLEASELLSFLQAVMVQREKEPDAGEAADEAALNLTHIRAGRIKLDAGAGDNETTASNLQRVYEDTVATAELVWQSAMTEGRPDLPTARLTIEGLAESVAEHRTALLGLAAMKKYDNYTFTHMVNVSILTLGQARTLGIEGRLLREIGLAALMHDIGKTRTPLEILNKPDKLTAPEFEIMKRHTVEGAEILRRTPEMPTLAPVVAFEHHMRLDGRGYPDLPVRNGLNLATMICGIADVYDAMRSKRKYQQAHPSERILAILQGNDGSQFDQNLVRRFIHMLGIYPPGSLVRLSTEEVALVVRPYAPDPYRPRVLVLIDREGTRLESPQQRDLWLVQGDTGTLATVACLLDPEAYGIDPLEYLAA